MKSFRMSRSTERRNAQKAIAFRGGAAGLAWRIPEEQAVVSGRRLRRAARSQKNVSTFAVRTGGVVEPLPEDFALAAWGLALVGGVMS